MKALSILLGAALVGVSALACLIDLSNNWHFGLSIRLELAFLLGVVAFCVFLIPLATGWLGASAKMRAIWWACASLTVFAALMNYAKEQGGAIDSVVADQGKFAAARADENAAKLILAKIGELAAADELEKLALASEADAERQAKNRFCGPECEKHKAAAKAYRERLSQAKARDAAQQRLDQASVITNAGAKQIDMGARLLAKVLGLSDAETARYMGFAMSLLSAFITQAIGLLAHPGMMLIKSGLDRPIGRQVSPLTAAPATPVAQAPKSEKKRIPRAKRTVPDLAIAEAQRWAEMNLTARANNRMASAALFEAYQNSGGQLTQATFGAALDALGYKREKRAGKIAYVGIAFRGLQAVNA